MKTEFQLSRYSVKALAIMGMAATALLMGTSGVMAAGYTIQQISSPGPAMRLSNNIDNLPGNDKVTGFYVAKCVTLSSQPKRTICYNAPWIYNGKRTSKLSGAWPSNANAKAVAVNDGGDLIGADLTGAWYYVNGQVTYTDPAPLSIPTDPITGQPDYSYLQPVRGTRLIAVKNPNPTIANEKIAIGTSSFLSQINPTVYVSKPVVYNANFCSLADWPYDNWNNCLHVIEFNDNNTYSVIDANDAGVITGTDGSGNVFVARISSFDIDPITSTIISNDIVPDNTVSNCRPVRISQVYFNPNNQNDLSNATVWVASNCSGNRAFRSQVNVTTQQLIRVDELSYSGSNLSVVSINSHGEAVGTAIRPFAYAPDGYTALVWSSTDPNNPTDLNVNNAFAPVSTNGVAWNVHATDIDEAGMVLTGYNDTSGNFYTFLLRPMP